MDNIIDIEYFTGEISIPNLSKDDGTDFETTYINNFQKKYLIRVLGYSMFKELKAELAKEDSEIDQKWKDLRDGVAYDVTVGKDTVTTIWNGLKNDEKISPIAYHVYSVWLKKNYSQLTGVGVGISSKANATTYSPNYKIVSAQNNEIDLTGNLRSYLSDDDYRFIKNTKKNKYYRDDLSFTDDSVKLDESLFMYLYHHRTDFDSWIFTNETKINVFGI